jgi:hypothetical protein
MAYSAAGLKKLGAGGSISSGAGSVKNVFHYATNDAANVVEASNYFNSAVNLFSDGAGDIIIASLDCDGTPATKTYVVVASQSAGTVALTPEVDAT